MYVLSRDPGGVREFVKWVNQNREPLHAELQACEGILDVLPELRRRGARLGIVTA